MDSLKIILITISTNIIIQNIKWERLYYVIFKIYKPKQLKAIINEYIFDKYYFSTQIRVKSNKLFMNKRISIKLLSWCDSCNTSGTECMTDNNKVIRLEKLIELDIIDDLQNNSMSGYKNYDDLISRLNGIYNDEEDSEYSNDSDDSDDSDDSNDSDDSDNSDDSIDETISNESNSTTLEEYNEENKDDVDINLTTDYNNDNELNPDDYIVQDNIVCSLYLEAHEIMFDNVPYIAWSLYLSQIIAIPSDYKNHPFRELENTLLDKNRYCRGIIIDNYISRNLLNEIMNIKSVINNIDDYRPKLIKALVDLSY
jgi:hypothetical protein